MSRRKIYWREHFRQSQDVEKILPHEARAQGTYWTNMHRALGADFARSPQGKGKLVTRPMRTEMESKVRGWAKGWGK
jgi:hypothetical protein